MTRRKSNPKANRLIPKAASKPKRNRDIKAASWDTQAPAARLVVGIGASVGGLEAFRIFFANMPSNSGMAFVLVQHLAPDHGSILTELISHSTAMKVVEATDGAVVVPNSIFVIPPNATLTIAAGHLHVVKPAPARENRRPIDTFMFSLAEDQGENAVCIILSGSGSDGAQGLAAIKEHGGITLAQAQFDETAMSGMPSSAAATGLVDHVLPVEFIPGKLLEYQRHLIDVRERKGSDGTREDARRHLDEVCALLDRGVGHDFSQYKEGTLVRRIQRRMQVRNFGDVAEYIVYLRKEPREVELLFRDLLIGVTHFFRDPDAFEVLETTVIPELLKNRDTEDQVRVWVAGCATGEEAYSIAILLQEAASKASTVPKFVIFATDINDTAITIARSGRYHKSRLDGLSSERIRQWFIEDGEYYCPIAEIRDMCVFSVHSLVKDPPFSRLNLVSCLPAQRQRRIGPAEFCALRSDRRLAWQSNRCARRDASRGCFRPGRTPRHGEVLPGLCCSR
jgi:two-component system CheB/CheR fusion protein